eukprot:ANDGO_05638.mRNA.1 DNA replication ATP-dependent helicase/nuclease DNA2
MCPRRAVLNEKFRVRLSIPTTEGIREQEEQNTEKLFFYGHMVHSLFQCCLRLKRWDLAFLKNAAAVYLAGEDIVESMQLIGLTYDAVFQCMETDNHWKSIQQFCNSFVSGSSPFDFYDQQQKKSSSTKMRIQEVLDVEECMWNPRIGVKGKIDASLQIQITGSAAGTEFHVAPFEIKTGFNESHKGSSIHRAQVMLYALMMSDRRAVPVSSLRGLLYYMKSNKLHSVNVPWNEVRSLMQLRNSLARTLESISAEPPFLKFGEMLGNWNVCGKCYQLATCLTVGKVSEGGLPRNSQIPENVWHSVTRHLSKSHSGFFTRFFRMVEIEERSVATLRRHMWTSSSQEREAIQGKCIGSLVLVHLRTVRSKEELVEAVKNVLRIASAHGFSSVDSQASAAAGAASMISCRAEDKENFLPEDELACQVEQIAASLPSASRIITFRRHDGAPSVSVTSPVRVGDHVVLSTEDGDCGVAVGYVVHVDSRSLSMVSHDSPASLAKDSGSVSEDSNGASKPVRLFRVDGDESIASFQVARDNLLQLMDARSESSKRLRDLIVDLQTPHFLPCNTECSRHVVPLDLEGLKRHLNLDQIQAILHVLRANDYSLILGMPGTGKTTTLAHLIAILAKSGKSVLLCSYTHSAVDAVLMKLVDLWPEFVRVGHARSHTNEHLHPAIASRTVDSLMTAEPTLSLREIVHRHKVFAATALSATLQGHPLFSACGSGSGGQFFDVCIVDEASQVTLPVVLGPLLLSRKFVLVGDHYQLPPVVRSPVAAEMGLDDSLFNQLAQAHPNACVSLTLQYRMNSDCLELANRLVYSGKLKCGGSLVSERRLVLPHSRSPQSRFSRTLKDCPEWFRRVVSSDQSVIWVDCPSSETVSSQGVVNQTEANLVAEIVAALVLGGLSHDSIGIITPLLSQSRLVRESLGCLPFLGKQTMNFKPTSWENLRSKEADSFLSSSADSAWAATDAADEIERAPFVAGSTGMSIEVHTIDKYQGRDKECVIVSLVRSNSEERIGDLLRDWRRMNVALTRSKSKLIIIGNAATFAMQPPWQQVLRIVREKNWVVQVPSEKEVDGGLDRWTSMLSEEALEHANLVDLDSSDLDISSDFAPL